MKYLLLFALLSLPWDSHAMEKQSLRQGFIPKNVPSADTESNQFRSHGGGKPKKPPIFGERVRIYSDDSPAKTIGSEYITTYNMLAEKIKELTTLIKSAEITDEDKIHQLFEVVNRQPLDVSSLESLIVKQTSAEIYKKCFLYQITALVEKQDPSATDYLNKYWCIAIDRLSVEKDQIKVGTHMECGQVS